MANMSISESYHGFHIEGKREYPTMGDYDRCVFHVTLNNKLLFRHSIRISRTYLHQIDVHQRGVDVTQLLLSRGFNQVCGKIDLKMYKDGEDTEYFIVGDESAISNVLTDKEIRLQILSMLYSVKRMRADLAMREPFNVEGFCEILGIEKSDYLVNASYLLGKKYVANFLVQQHTVDKGGVYITSDGIDYLEEGGNPRPITNINTGGGDFVGRDKRMNE